MRWWPGFINTSTQCEETHAGSVSHDIHRTRHRGSAREQPEYVPDFVASTSEVSLLKGTKKAMDINSPVIRNPFDGTWRIVWMSAWDQDYVDMDGPGHTTFSAGRKSFQLDRLSRLASSTASTCRRPSPSTATAISTA